MVRRLCAVGALGILGCGGAGEVLEPETLLETGSIAIPR